MDDHMDNQNNGPQEPTPPQGPTPLHSERAPQEAAPQETTPPPEFDPSAPPIPPEPVAPQTETPPPPTSSSEMSKDEKMWGMFCHLAGLVGYLPVLPLPIGNILGPLILWLIKKDESPFVDEQGKEALNFQISISIYMIASFLLCFMFIGLLLVPAVGIFNLVMIIIASIKSNNGEAYRYPLCLRLVK